MHGNLITALVLTAAAVLEFLKLPHEGIEFSPEVLLVLGVLSVIVTTVARFLPAQGAPIPVTVSGAPGQPGVAITETTTAGVTPAPTDYQPGAPYSDDD